MALIDEKREKARLRFAAALDKFHRQMEGVTEEEVLDALRDDDDEPSRNGRGARRRASASTRTPSQPA